MPLRLPAMHGQAFDREGVGNAGRHNRPESPCRGLRGADAVCVWGGAGASHPTRPAQDGKSPRLHVRGEVGAEPAIPPANRLLCLDADRAHRWRVAGVTLPRWCAGVSPQFRRCHEKWPSLQPLAPAGGNHPDEERGEFRGDGLNTRSGRGLSGQQIAQPDVAGIQPAADRKRGFDHQQEVHCPGWARRGASCRCAGARRQLVARVDGVGAWSPTRVPGHAMRTYSGRPRSSMRFSASAAMATSVARRPSVRERSPSPMTRFQRPISASTKARQL